MQRWQWMFGCLIAAGLLVAAPVQADREWEESTPFYEDDAWYDISEWFDGNDYNPTDEVVGRIDDEVYSVSDDTGSDIDDDYAYDSTDTDSWYGYDEEDSNDNWFYDYYDYRPNFSQSRSKNQQADFAYGYYDYDGDGYYDAYTYALDRDSDGIYEWSRHYTLNDAGRQNRGKKDAKVAASRQISGTVSQKKQVNVASNQHLLVSLRDNKLTVDLGPVDDFDNVEVDAGDQLIATGPVVMVGNRKVMVAQQASIDGEKLAIQREGRRFQGEIAGTRRQKTQDGDRQFVILVSDSGTKRIIDLGPADQVDVKLREGTKISVSGVPVNVEDRRVILAEKLIIGDRELAIERQSKKRSSREES